ncbi:MAG: phosphoenolpyruvate hydrolase family protein [Syntrophomonadaceae bacterium]|nr:phosphoenolpyruvate hydrolase family protein [Syntrophomonadaceae bacterium]
MAKKYTRSQILERLNAQINLGRSILMFGAGIGLTAKCADIGGADLIAVYSTARYRMIGQSTLLAWLPYGDANECVAKMAREIIPVVKEAPCIAGIGAHNPALDLDKWLDEMMDLGFSGITNEPFVGLYGEFFAGQLEAAGIGFSREVNLIEKAHKKDIFTVAWAFNPEEAKTMAAAGADVIGAIIGVTAGGLTGSRYVVNLEEAVTEVQKICTAAKAVNPDIIILTHGGPFKDVETAQYSINHSSAAGYASGSSGERIPTEKAVIDLTRAYKKMSLI